MIKASREKDRITIAKVHESGQDHVFRFWEELGSTAQRKLLAQLDEIDFQLVTRLVHRLLSEEENPIGCTALEPAPVIQVPRTAEQEARHQKARKLGEDVLAAGKVAALMVAGGQASRLGISAPKGTVPVGPVSGKSLFQLHVEKTAALPRRFRAQVPLLVMTSDSTHEATVETFETHRYFGMSKADVRFLRQRMLPAVDRRGKFILETQGRIFTNPNGHGGVFQALVESGALDELIRRGIEHVFYFQVDNPLVVLCDPVFIGYHVEAGSDFSVKVAPKTGPEEKVGVLAKKDGVLGVIEYSDLPDDLANARGPDGRLRFDAGNLAIHVLSVEFVRRFADLGYPLHYHRAEKAIPYCDRRGAIVNPRKKNGFKFETFIFDALEHAKDAVVLEVNRDEEFSPVKNATGPDSIDTARGAMSTLARRWLERAGLLKADLNGGDRRSFEISPTYALDEVELRERAPGPERLKDEKVYLE